MAAEAAIRPSSALGYCGEELRRYDHDRYLACLFAPRAARAHLFALYAFNLEVAKTPEVVSEAMLGRIRLQWWREAIEGIYAGSPRQHEVVEPLAIAVAERGLTRDHFERLIDAREADLEPASPGSLAALEAYAEATSSTLVWLALEVLGAQDESSRRAGRGLGIAWAYVGLLRALPFHAGRRRLYLPQDLMAQAGLEATEVFAGRSPPALRDVVSRLATEAGRHLGEARRLRPSLPKAAGPALLPACLAGGYLRILARAGHDPFDPRVQSPQPGRAWRLLWAALTGRY
ncbi:MAG: phytoene/squalene synthase family protein [Kiloniellales bacterium]|nr:phytoene/squalene synthase family protein [Kiloniellales bacterium]